MKSKSAKKRKIYVTYSHRDRRWLEELLTHFAALRMDAEIWSDARIDVGADWRSQITEAIETADAVILLVSADFLASDFLTEVELPSILRAAQTRGTLALPILIRPCLWEETPLSEFQFLNPPDKPLASLSSDARDRAYVDIVGRLSSVLSKPEPMKPGLVASTDFAEEIARKVFDRFKADLEVFARPKTSSRSDPQDQMSSLVAWSPDGRALVKKVVLGGVMRRSRNVIGTWH